AASARRPARSMPSSRGRTSSSPPRRARSSSTTRRNFSTTAPAGRPRSPVTSNWTRLTDERVPGTYRTRSGHGQRPARGWARSARPGGRVGRCPCWRTGGRWRGIAMTEAFQRLFARMLEQGQEMARAFNPALENFSVAGMDKLMPTLSKDMMEMWFGKTFNREGLDAKTRLLVTVAALTVLGAQAEPQMRLTIRHALEAGATKREIAEVIYQMSM